MTRTVIVIGYCGLKAECWLASLGLAAILAIDIQGERFILSYTF